MIKENKIYYTCYNGKEIFTGKSWDSCGDFYSW